MKPVSVTNRETGEVWTDFEVTLDVELDEPENLLFGARVKGKKIGKESFGWYKRIEEDDKPQPSHEQFGNMVVLGDPRKFTKVYQLEKPTFSSPNFRAYWFEISYALAMNTGIIQFRAKRGTVQPVHTTADWETLLQCKRSTVSAFVSECKANGYIAKVEYKNMTFYIVNPRYQWNGNLIPEAFWDLFAQMNGCPNAWTCKNRG